MTFESILRDRVCAVQGGELHHYDVCRTYGAPESFSRGFPGLTAWAKLCRTSGARGNFDLEGNAKRLRAQTLFKWLRPF